MRKGRIRYFFRVIFNDRNLKCSTHIKELMSFWLHSDRHGLSLKREFDAVESTCDFDKFKQEAEELRIKGKPYEDLVPAAKMLKCLNKLHHNLFRKLNGILGSRSYGKITSWILQKIASCPPYGGAYDDCKFAEYKKVAYTGIPCGRQFFCVWCWWREILYQEKILSHSFGQYFTFGKKRKSKKEDDKEDDKEEDEKEGWKSRKGIGIGFPSKVNITQIYCIDPKFMGISGDVAGEPTVNPEGTVRLETCRDWKMIKFNLTQFFKMVDYLRTDMSHKCFEDVGPSGKQEFESAVKVVSPICMYAGDGNPQDKCLGFGVKVSFIHTSPFPDANFSKSVKVKVINRGRFEVQFNYPVSIKRIKDVPVFEALYKYANPFPIGIYDVPETKVLHLMRLLYRVHNWELVGPLRKRIEKIREGMAVEDFVEEKPVQVDKEVQDVSALSEAMSEEPESGQYTEIDSAIDAIMEDNARKGHQLYEARALDSGKTNI